MGHDYLIRYLSESEGDDGEMTTMVSFEEIYRVLVFIVVVHYSGVLVHLTNTPPLVGQIFAGILLGPQVADFVPFESGLVVIGEIGLVFLLFKAGIMMDTHLVQKSGTRAVTMAIVCALLATGCGIGVGYAFGEDFQGAFSIGATFAQTSISTCLPILHEGRLIDKPIGQMLLAGTMTDNILSLTFLSLVVAFGSDGTPSVMTYVIPIVSSVSLLAVLGYFAVKWAPHIIDDVILLKCHSKFAKSSVLWFLMTVITCVYLPLFKICRSSHLMGAMVSGLTFSQCNLGQKSFSLCDPVFDWLMKLFYSASIGFQVPILLFGEGAVWYKGAVLIISAVLVKAVAALFVPKFQAEDTVCNVYKRDRTVAAIAMITRDGFGFLTCSIAVNASLIDAQMYASLVLAILVATVIPPCMLSATIRKFEAEEIIAKHKSSLEQKSDDTDPLFVRIAITSKGMWGLLEKLSKEVSATGLGVEDFMSTHSNGTDSTMITTFFLRDTKLRIMIKKVALQRSIRNLALSNDMSERIKEENQKIESRLREIQGQLAKNLESIHVQSIDTCQWFPFEAYLDGLFKGPKPDPSLMYLTSLFHVLDIDGGGSLDIDELRIGLETNGFHADDNGLKLLMNTVDQDGDGEISFNEWEEAIKLYLEKRNEIIRVEFE